MEEELIMWAYSFKGGSPVTLPQALRVTEHHGNQSMSRTRSLISWQAEGGEIKRPRQPSPFRDKLPLALFFQPGPTHQPHHLPSVVYLIFNLSIVGSID